MRVRATTAGVLFVLTLSVIIGCAKYKVTHELEIPIDRTSACEIGDIKDLLPPDVEPEDRPTADDLDRLAHEVRTQLEQQGVFDVVGVGPAPTVYEVTGGILTLKRGSGAVRFFIGFGLGDAKLTAELRLQEVTTGRVVFAGNFTQTVSNWAEKGDVVYERVAKDFAKALKKRTAELQKQAAAKNEKS